MDIHYNAFISYRHHPDDIRVARQIHRSLERFHIPRAIQKKRQQRGGMRLFRDKEELPITSNLNDDIDDALRNSDYLIVICSVHTKESIWVQREIELFLKTHHRSKVLTVLASGEPYDVIPEILLKEDVADPETGEIRQVLVEPLSCDWRIGRRKAVREELPRLAAPLLGCAYDELRQRQRQYRTRRLTAILTAALLSSLALAAYFLQTSITIQRANIRIQENLEQSQRNQSRHLATAAREKLLEGDRLSAIALAAAALPSEENVRPYVAEAEFVLTDALGIYRPTTQVKAVGAVSPGSQIGIRKFWVSEADHSLYIYDTRYELTVWNTQTMEKRANISLGDSQLIDLYPLPGGNALVYTDGASDALYCYTPDGTCLWKTADIRDVALCSDGTILALLREDAAHDILRFLDAATGEEIRRSLPLDGLTGENGHVQLCAEFCSAGAPVLICCSGAQTPDYYLLNPDDGSCKTVPIPDKYLKLAVTAGRKLFVMGMEEGNSIMGSFVGNRVTAPIYSPIRCYDTETGGLLWESSVSAYTFVGCNTLAPVPGRDWLLCQCGNAFQILDMTTGETVARCEAGSSVLSVSMGEMFASCILEDGYRCNYWYEENYCYETKCLESGLTQAMLADGFYGLKFDGTTVTVYREQSATENWLAAVEGSATATDSLICGDQAVVQNYSQTYLLDTAAHTVRWQQPGGSRKLLAFSQNGTRFWSAEGNRRLVETDTAAGTDTVLDLEALAGEQKGSIPGDLFLQEDMLFYVLSLYDGGNYLVCRDMTSGEETKYSLGAFTAEDSVLRCQLIKKHGQKAWLWTEAETVLELDMTTGTLRQLLDGISRRPAAVIGADGLPALADGSRILLLTSDGTVHTTVDLGEVKCGSLCFYNDQLLALCDDGFIHRFDASGVLLSMTQLQVGAEFAGDLLNQPLRDTIRWQFTQDRKLILNTFCTGNVIDCDTWKPVSTITNFLHYSETGDCFICYVNGGAVGYHRRSLPELLELARQALDGFTLTAEQKAAYGLE